MGTSEDLSRWLCRSLKLQVTGVQNSPFAPAVPSLAMLFPSLHLLGELLLILFLIYTFIDFLIIF